MLSGSNTKKVSKQGSWICKNSSWGLTVRGQLIELVKLSKAPKSHFKTAIHFFYIKRMTCRIFLSSSVFILNIHSTQINRGLRPRCTYGATITRGAFHLTEVTGQTRHLEGLTLQRPPGGGGLPYGTNGDARRKF